MKRFALLLVAALALWTGRAQAQSQPLTVSVDGKQPPTNIDREFIVGLDQCKASVSFTFAFAATFAKEVKTLELWVRKGTASCFDAASRAKPTQGEAPCWWAGAVAPTAMELSIPALKLFSREGKACDEVQGEKYQVSLVPLATTSDPDTATANEPVMGASLFSATFALYTEAPAAPTAVKGRTGEKNLTVEWEAPSGAPTGTTYRVYYDTAQTAAPNAPDAGGSMPSDAGQDALDAAQAIPADAGQDAQDAAQAMPPDAGASSNAARAFPPATHAQVATKCGSGQLQAGKAPPEAGGTISTVETGSGSASVPASGIAIKQFMAVGVVAVDPAGNESLLSEVICIERVDSEGFKERYDRLGGDGLESCSVKAPGRAAWGGVTSLTLIGLGLAWRRRRNA